LWRFARLGQARIELSNGSEFFDWRKAERDAPFIYGSKEFSCLKCRDPKVTLQRVAARLHLSCSNFVSCL
ncbi:hypothetical protein ABTE93_20460, partial [Acinetobacter baumannii]